MSCMRSEKKKNAVLGSGNSNLKVAAGTVITSEDQKSEESVVAEKLNKENKRISDWALKDPSGDMASLPKTNACGSFGSPTTSTTSAMTSNTSGYENKVSNVGLSLVDGIKVAVVKKVVC